MKFSGIFNEEKIIFIQINKCATVSILKALGCEQPPGHKTAYKMRKKVGHKKWKAFFKFAVVRNPWDKMVSHFFAKQKSDQLKISRTHAGYINISFSDWIKTEQFINDDSRFLNNQYDWLTNHKHSDLIIVDYIARFENLQEEWAKICKMQNIDKTLDHVNRSEHGAYRTYYDDESIEIVSNKFKKDIEFFGYEF